MKTQGKCRALFAYLVILFVAISAGCGGGGGDKPPTGTPPGTEGFIVQAGQVPIVAVFVNETAVLDGSTHSYASTGEPLSYAWSFNDKPPGSNAQLQNATSAQVSFVPDVVGTYMVQLVVTANGVSDRDVALVLVTQDDPNDPNDRPSSGPWNHAGLSSYCANCHDGTYPLDPNGNNIATPKSGDHLSTSNKCQACHTTFGFEIPMYFDHHEIFDNCSNCHNGVLAIGKSQFHDPTSAECDECHNTDQFVELPQNQDGSYDHTSIDKPCTACHNAIVAKGKADKTGAPHLATDKDCGLCHTTIAFKPAFVDHSNITQPCGDCHNGTDAKGQIAGHPVTTNIVDCGICHHTSMPLTFSLGGVFDHSVVDPSVLPCETCHNDNNSIHAPGKQSAGTFEKCFY